ncbi:hypothetical protein DEU37_1136 [Microbacterium sp. AG790]|uniref:hypothetical protein n=1 Tax=Microbacterium sp. AG790 TaxID=2183995 RepID=UPI000F121D79|nr:hypothetical protein [Microbacterium sp. AG790]RKS93716.1 hypothetical protein DEU37_1136 [Microbacterium sp. AG790]
MPTFLAGFSESGNYRARLETNETGGWALYGDKLAGSGFWTSDAQGWAVSINGQNWSGAYTYDYRGTSSILIASGSYSRPALTSTFGASASVSMDSGIGNASPSGSFTAYGTATAPDAPTGVSIDQIAPSSLRYIFSGNGNGGAAIDQWQAQVASDSAFTANLQTVTSSGTTTFTSLTPATTY